MCRVMKGHWALGTRQWDCLAKGKGGDGPRNKSQIPEMPGLVWEIESEGGR